MLNTAYTQVKIDYPTEEYVQCMHRLNKQATNQLALMLTNDMYFLTDNK